MSVFAPRASTVAAFAGGGEIYQRNREAVLERTAINHAAATRIPRTPRWCRAIRTLGFADLRSWKQTMEQLVRPVQRYRRKNDLHI